MAYAKIRPRRGTATQWVTANPVLAEGEMGIEVPDTGVGTGTVKFKFGDGVTAWNDLPYGMLKISDHIVQNLESTDVTKVPSVVAVKTAIDDIYEELKNCMMLKGGTELVANDDLDDFLEPGRYYCRTEAICNFIASTPPISQAFTMIVDFGNGHNYPRQTVYTVNGDKIFSRTYNSTSNKWYNDGTWKELIFS